MILVGNVDYAVTIRMPSGTLQTVRLTYCGGSVVDEEGHYLSGGVWVHASTQHPNYLYLNNLRVLNIRPVHHKPEGVRQS